MRKPLWLKRNLPEGQGYEHVRTLISKNSLNTVCQEARCPNRFECFSEGTATFLILGNLCTRNCRFCNIETGEPGSVDILESIRVADAAECLNLNYVVVTSVTRDDLPNGGAEVFAKTTSELIKKIPGVYVELLVPDFRGNIRSLDMVLGSGPVVLNHNLETVPRLYGEIRPGAAYTRSLKLLERVKKNNDATLVKSGLMLGLGETRDEIKQTLGDMYSAGCDIVTMGQYLQPSKYHKQVHYYISPEEFDRWKDIALKIGFKAVAAGPFVRSSYHAKKLYLTGLVP